MPAMWRVHSPFFHDFSKKIITRKLYEIKTWNLEHTFSSVSACDIMCSSLLSTEKSSFFLDIFSHTHTRHFRVGVLSFFVRGIWTNLWFFCFPRSLPGGSFFGARFGGVGVGVLLEPRDSSDDDDCDDTASDVCIRFSVISEMKSRNDLRELGLFFEKVT